MLKWRMRVVIGIESYLPNVSGVVVATRRLASYLVKKGHTVSIITSSSRTFWKRDTNGTSIFRLKGFSNPFRKNLFFSSPANFLKIRSLFDTIKPDIVHLQDPGILNFLILKEAKKRKIPVVAHHQFPMEFILSYFDYIKIAHPALKFFAEAYLCSFYNQAQIIISPSNFLKKILLEWGVKSPIKIIPNGVDINRFYPRDNQEDLAPLFKKYDISPSADIVLYIGRLEKDKNIITLFKAIPQILKNHNAFFLFVGEGKEKKKIFKLVEKNIVENNVRFVDFIPYEDEILPQIYRMAKVFWISSFEAQSMSTLEALASGLPVVAADVSALPEIVKNNINGFLVDAYESGQFKEAVIKILKSNNLLQRFSKESVRIASSFNLSQSLSAIEELYKKL